jgi:NAD(P)H-hydrate epimerase
MGFAKTGLVADAATDFVGRLAVAGLAELDASACGDSDDHLISPPILREFLPPRAFETHKGMAGRVAVLAGSAGFPGAARLCSAAAVAGGAGLITLVVKKDAYPSLASSVIPEVMVRQLESYEEILADHWDAIAVGPGLSPDAPGEIASVIRRATCPCVVDAEALNMMSADLETFHHCAGPRLLTPHPGEMERLSPRHDKSRREWMQNFVRKYPVTLLLKGARTIIGEADKPAAYNTTGHPGMATGGMGDVLTGILSALLAQGLSPLQAAMAGAWVCGRAAEIAISTGGESQESLRASHVLLNAGKAFSSLRAGSF